MYNIGLHDTRKASRWFPLRTVRLESLQDGCPVTRVRHRASLRTILLLRHRPRIQPREPIYLPLNHSFRPAICIPEHLIHSLLDRQVVSQVNITNARLPWLGDPPLVIAFREEALYDTDALYAMVQVGRCTSHSTNGEDSGSLWATFRGSPSRWEHEDYSHQCPEDHLLNWADSKKCFVLKFFVADDVMDDHIAKWLLNIAFTLSVTRGVLIMTHITLAYRPLLQSCDYRDIVEDGPIVTEMDTDTDAEGQHARQSPSVSTPGNTANQAVPSTEVIDWEEIASLDEDCQSAVDASHNHPLCRGFPLHPFICSCFKGHLAALNYIFPLSVLECIRFDALFASSFDGSSTYDSSLFMYSSTLNDNLLSYEGFPLLLP